MSESGQETLPRCPGVVEAPYGFPGVVGSPSRMSGSDLEAFTYVRVVGSLSQMFGCGWEALPDVREALSVVWEWSGGPLGCPRVVGRLTRMSRNGWEALPDVQ